MSEGKIPQHVAIIMDGNGRWAEDRGLSRTKGHLEGVKRIEEILEVVYRRGVKYLTLFTFSTENWSRPKSEVRTLMTLLASVLAKKINNLHENNIKFQIIGRKEGVPSFVSKVLDAAVEKTKANDGLFVNLAFNYGGRIEILDAVRLIAKVVQEGKMLPEEITEETISGELYTRGMPDPDLLIRTSGEKRISNFLLWQLSYAEFYFTEKYWPDFNEQEFDIALVEYQGRERRYGDVTARKS